MKVGVVIVNYNVEYFLEQCLESVRGSRRETAGGERMEIEVTVVDNASVDGSVEMVRERFPEVRLIVNGENRGFAAANNQAIRECEDADYVLLLNPDTVVESDTLVRCVDFFAEHADCGGLGVKMINGEGRYLKESKRGFPTPEASFFKISGLIRLFPRSRRIAAYYMGHLPEDEVNEVEILPGAFLMVRREALEKTGLLDEEYFMYGEDIDFSWRIRLAGWKNYYVPTARIIHYKGESTKRGSMNYVYTFYNAMSIFVRHYYSGKNARLFGLLLHVAIWSRAVVSFLERLLKAVALPVADFAVAYGGFLCIEALWSAHRLGMGVHLFDFGMSYYPPEYMGVVIPIYILILMAGSWLAGGYVKPVRLMRIVKGMAMGTAVLLVFYSLLDESLRYSRALLLMGCAWTMLATVGIRGVLSLMGVEGYDVRRRRLRRCLIVGSAEECVRIEGLYGQTEENRQFATLNVETPGGVQAGRLRTELLSDAVRINKAEEVVFSGKDLSVQRIIDLMTGLKSNRYVEFKIAPGDSDFIIGANSVHSLVHEGSRGVKSGIRNHFRKLLKL